MQLMVLRMRPNWSTHLRLIALCAAVAIVAIPTLLWLAQALALSALKIQINSNEGWNAYWAQQVLSGQPLYPSPDGLISNNYPPLSFLLIAAVAHVGLDPWIAGRMLAWLSLMGCAVLMIRILCDLGCGLLKSAFSAVLFCGIVAVHYNSYVGMYDPQLTAHFFMLLGLRQILRTEHPDVAATIRAALLIGLGAFFKHNLIALPLALTIWLAISHRRLLLAWLTTGTAIAAFGLVVFTSLYGADFIWGLLTPRAWSVHRGINMFLAWVWPLQVPLVIAFIPLMRSLRDKTAIFIALFCVTAVVETFTGAMGDRVSYNAAFDLLIAACLGVGFAQRTVHSGSGSPVDYTATWIALMCAASFLFSTTVVATIQNISPRAWRDQLDRKLTMSSRTVDVLKSTPGPALCQDLIMCYWALKPLKVDLRYYVESVKTHRRDYAELVRLIDARKFGAIELQGTNGGLDSVVLDAIARNYKSVPNLSGVFVRAAP